MDLTRFYNQFREETTENVRILSDGLLALESTADPTDADARAQVDAMFRAVHTIKGSARMLGFAELGRLAHTMEDVLGAVRAGQFALDKALTTHLLKSSDALLDLTTSAIDGTPATADVEALVSVLRDVMPAPVEAPVAEPDAAADPADAAPAEQINGAPAAASPAYAPPAADVASPPGDGPNGTEQPAATATAPPAPPPDAAGSSTFRARAVNRQTVRVRTDRLDRLINLTGELVIGQQTLHMHSQMLRELAALTQQQERLLLAMNQELRQQHRHHQQNGELDQHINMLLNTSDQIHQLLRNEVEEFAQYVNQNHALVDHLEQEVISTRLLPISNLFATLPRAVRELSDTTGKDIHLSLYGEATELDRKLLEALSDPLIHLVRNAIDHGIEVPEERVAAGKSGQGSLEVRAEAAGGEVRITIRDDGRGIEPQRIRDAAVKKGLMSAEKVALLNDQEALDLIFLPGFTTAPILTDLSGRGVGMDVVRTNIGELNGQVQLESQPGEGTTVTLLLPFTLVTTRILLVRVGEQRFAVPASGCQGVIWVDQERLHTIEGRAVIRYGERTVPVMRLADLLDVEAEPAFLHEERMPAILLGSDKRLLSLLVDRVLDEREAVVKPIGPLLEFQRRYSGAIQLGNGQLVLMLNPVTLAHAARGVTLASSVDTAGDSKKQHRLLISDDSFTTRELMRSILHSAGYDVTTAVDGMDALDKLQAQSYDLVVSDVEMPRLNGFELTESIRQQLGLTDLPVIIVTSLASDEHKRRGMEAGAQAYIVKSQFNQDNLLDAIQQLLGQ
jgi:two-component system chemotaxis sensor kinase CheA